MTDGTGEDDRIGSVGDEATKLLHALQDWVQRSGDEHADATAAAAAGVAAAVADIGEHVATGGAQCRYCPVCQVISVARSTTPEVRQHLAAAATSLMHAAAGVMATQPPDPEAPPAASFGKPDLNDDERENHR